MSGKKEKKLRKLHSAVQGFEPALPGLISESKPLDCGMQLPRVTGCHMFLLHPGDDKKKLREKK
jgi:hypothetical protein